MFLRFSLCIALVCLPCCRAMAPLKELKDLEKLIIESQTQLNETITAVKYFEGILSKNIHLDYPPKRLNLIYIKKLCEFIDVAFIDSFFPNLMPLSNTPQQGSLLVESDQVYKSLSTGIFQSVRGANSARNHLAFLTVHLFFLKSYIQKDLLCLLALLGDNEPCECFPFSKTKAALATLFSAFLLTGNYKKRNSGLEHLDFIQSGIIYTKDLLPPLLSHLYTLFLLGRVGYLFKQYNYALPASPTYKFALHNLQERSRLVGDLLHTCQRPEEIEKALIALGYPKDIANTIVSFTPSSFLSILFKKKKAKINKLLIEKYQPNIKGESPFLTLHPIRRLLRLLCWLFIKYTLLFALYRLGYFLFLGAKALPTLIGF